MVSSTLKLPVKPPPVSDVYLPPAAVDKLGKVERQQLAQSLRKLRYEQRLFLHALLASASQREALDRLRETGMELDKSTVSRWTRSPTFVNAWRLLERAYVRNITKDGVLAKTQAILERALTPKPILYKGEETGYEEVDLGAAVRALELQGKATGAWADEQQKQVVVVDIDFSGRPAPPVEDPLPFIEGEIVESGDEDWLS